MTRQLRQLHLNCRDTTLGCSHSSPLLLGGGLRLLALPFRYGSGLCEPSVSIPVKDRDFMRGLLL